MQVTEMEIFGGIVERGEVSQVHQDGYIISSLDRNGIITRPIKPVGTESYKAGDRVYYFIFNDGTGRIICGM